MKKSVPVLDIMWALVLYGAIALFLLKVNGVNIWLNSWMTENPTRLWFGFALVMLGTISQSYRLYGKFRG